MKSLSLPNFSQLEKSYPSYMGVTYALTGHTIFITTNFGIQSIGKRLNTFQILYGIGMVLFLLNFFITKYKKLPIYSTDTKTTRMLFTRATITPVGALLIVFAFSLNAISECTAIQMTTPAFTAVLARLFLGEAYDLMLFLNTVLCFMGVVFISKPSFLFGEGSSSADYPYRSFGILMTLSGAFVSSFGQIALRKLGSMVSPIVNTLYFGFFLCCVNAVAQIVVGLGPVLTSDVIGLGFIGAIQCVAHNLMNKAFSLGNTATISLMMYSQVFLAYLIDVLYRGAQLDFYSIVGASSIFFCMFVTLFRLRMNNKGAK